MPSPNAIEHPKKAALIAAVAEVYCVLSACEAASVGRTTHYDWMRDDPEYAAAFEEARKVGAKSLEREAIRRARDGVDEPVFYKGAQCGAVRKYSDTLLIFLMKGAEPDKYRERSEVKLDGNLKMYGQDAPVSEV